MRLGILVAGGNHFIVRGPQPDRAVALALFRHWSFIQIGQTTPPELRRWRISTKAFREDLEWAIVLQTSEEISPAVEELLAELAARASPLR